MSLNFHYTDAIMCSTIPYAASAASVAVLLATGTTARAGGDLYEGLIPQPALDRWMYPFNATPGTRPSISTFGSTPGDTLFDSRDAQMLIRFDLGPVLPTGLGASRYQIESLRVTVQFDNNLVVEYDPTPDPWQNFLDPEDPQWQPDPDPGQPIELFGVGFRNGFSLMSFQENSPFTVPPNSPMAPSVRNAYALSFDEQGAPIDISNNPRQGFNPKSWAVGIIPELEPGDLIPINTRMHFDIDVADPDIQAYLRSGTDAGRLMFALSSLHFVVQQGGNFPSFYAKENAFVIFNLADAAQLTYSIRVLPECDIADFNCDGLVDGADLGTLLGFWGPCPAPCPADLDGDGEVDGADLGVLLGRWTN